MYITVNEIEYELTTTLGVIRRIEEKFRRPMTEIFANLGNAYSKEFADLITIAAKPKNPDFTASLFDDYDFSWLFLTVQELVATLMFSGTPEEKEKKIAKFPVPEEQKNEFRALVGLPETKISTGNE